MAELPDRDRLTAACREVAASGLRTLDAQGTVSVWAGGLDGGVWACVDGEHPHYAASTMKLPLLVAAHRRQARGELDLDASVPIVNQFSSSATGEFSMHQEDDQDDETWERLGGRASLRWLLEHAITRSGNLATNVVLRHVGTAEVNAVLDDAGCSATTRVLRGIEDGAAREAGLDNMVTAADLGRLMVAVAGHALVPGSSGTEIEAVLARQHYRDGIPAGLPEGTYTANKTGWVTGVCHDVALVRPDDAPAYVLAVCITAPAGEAELEALVRETSRTVWELSR